MSGKQIDWDLSEEIECPLCVEYMTCPIKMSENRHNICGGCKERLSDCPICRGNFNNFRNITLEKIAATAICPCKNMGDGCKETVTVVHKDNHLSVCFRTYSVQLENYLALTARGLVLCQT